jgi:polyhydroxyalkanoate synthesis regulator phasin
MARLTWEDTTPVNPTNLNKMLQEADVEALEADVEALETEVAALEGDVAALEADVEALETDVEALETDVATLETDVAALEGGLKPPPAESFAGSTGCTITHNYGHTDYQIIINPVADPEGYLGEIWISKANNTAIIYNSGIATGDFDYVIIPNS